MSSTLRRKQVKITVLRWHWHESLYRAAQGRNRVVRFVDKWLCRRCGKIFWSRYHIDMILIWPCCPYIHPYSMDERLSCLHKQNRGCSTIGSTEFSSYWHWIMWCGGRWSVLRAKTMIGRAWDEDDMSWL